MARSAERRRSLAYEWNTGELTRRQKRMETMEVETREFHRKIAELMLDIARLEAQVGKLNGIVNERGSIKKTARSEEHTSELQSLMRISYAVFCLKKKTNKVQ